MMSACRHPHLRVRGADVELSLRDVATAADNNFNLKVEELSSCKVIFGEIES